MATQADLALQALQGEAAPAPRGTQADQALAMLNAAQPSAQTTQPSRPWYAQIGDSANAFTHHALNIPRGIDQYVTNAVGGVAGMLPDNPISRALQEAARSKNENIRQQEENYQRSTPNSKGAYVGAVAGEAAPFLIGGVAPALNDAGTFVAEKTIRALPDWAARAAPFLSRVISGGTQGAIIGASSPVTSAGEKKVADLVTGEHPVDYWNQKTKQVAGGMAIGAAIPAATQTLSAVARGVGNAVAPLFAPQKVVAPALRDWAMQNGDDLATVLQNLKSATELVPGSKPTTAQVIANPAMVAAEKTASNNPAIKNLFQARDIANNAARLAQVEGVAGTPGALAAALKARGDATTPVRQAILDNGKAVDAAPILNQLETLRKSPLGIRPTIGAAANDLTAAIKERATQGANGELMVSPGDLDSFRQNVKDYLAKHSTNGVVGSQQEVAFEPIRNAIVDAVEGANPGYRAYLADYAKGSRPINTMEAAGRVLDDVSGSGRSANAAGDAQVTLGRYSQALARALKKAPYGISHEGESALRAVEQDLQRASISNSVRVPGSDTAYNLQAPGWLSQQLYGSNFAGTPNAARVVGGLAGGIGGALHGGPIGATTGAVAGAATMNKLAQMGQERVNAALADALLNPGKAAALLQSQAIKGPTKAALAALLAQRAPQLLLASPGAQTAAQLALEAVPQGR